MVLGHARGGERDGMSIGDAKWNIVRGKGKKTILGLRRAKEMLKVRGVKSGKNGCGRKRNHQSQSAKKKGAKGCRRRLQIGGANSVGNQPMASSRACIGVLAWQGTPFGAYPVQHQGEPLAICVYSPQSQSAKERKVMRVGCGQIAIYVVKEKNG